MTNAPIYKGEPLTEERAERIAEGTLAELAAMTPEERKAAERPPGALAKRIGRPRLGAGESEQIRVRVTADRLAVIDRVAERQHQSRSELLREALDEYLASR